MTHVVEYVNVPESVTEVVTDSVTEVVYTIDVVSTQETESISETQTLVEVLESFAVEIVSDVVAEVEVVAEAAPQGPPGPPGPSGVEAARITRLAGIDIGGHRAIYVAEDNTFRYADAATEEGRAVAGVTVGAASTGTAAYAQYAGELVEPSWSWSVGMPVFLGTNGMLTQSPLSSGLAIIIGIAVGADRILIRIGSPVYLT